ncbi:ribosomal protein L30p/L7e-domain-containing protein [Xylaria sp. FL0933]|nr:ribosomal protein L30p/L7e-domain-containing protein [Xylaria sp. FL0933]
MSYFRITLHRSAIGLPQRTRGVLAALGLRKRSQTVFHPVTPDSAGMIMKVKELVLVKEVEEALTTKQLRAERKPEPGFWIEKAVPRQERKGDRAAQILDHGAEGFWALLSWRRARHPSTRSTALHDRLGEM